MSSSTKAAALSTLPFEEQYPHLLPHSQLLTGYNNEDAAAELLVLDHLKSKKAKGLTALMITGGGDNFLSVLADSAVKHVTMVDMNPVAQALAQLKLALACSDLSSKEILTFMGSYDKVDEVKMDRMDVYEKALKPTLPSPVAEIIDTKLALEIKEGYNVHGSLQNCNRHLNHLLAKEGFAVQSLWDGTCDMDALEKLCYGGKLMSADVFLDVGNMKTKLPPHVLEHVTGELSRGKIDYIVGSYHKMAKLRVQSHIVSMTFRGHYTDDLKPAWLDPEIRAAVRAKRDQVTFITSDFAALMTEDADKYDLISTSNIYDWAPTPKIVADLTALGNTLLASGGIIFVRRGFAGVGEIVSQLETLEFSPHVKSEHLATADLSPFFHDLTDGMAALQVKA